MWIIIVGVIVGSFLLICYAIFTSMDFEDNASEEDLPWKGFTDHD